MSIWTLPNLEGLLLNMYFLKDSQIGSSFAAEVLIQRFTIFLLILQASEVSEIQPGLCSYPRSPAYALGIIAALSLLVAHIVINVASGCICCRRNPYTSATHWTLSLVCFIMSWYSSISGVLSHI